MDFSLVSLTQNDSSVGFLQKAQNDKIPQIPQKTKLNSPNSAQNDNALPFLQVDFFAAPCALQAAWSLRSK